MMKHIYILSCETDGGIYHYLFENGKVKKEYKALQKQLKAKKKQGK